jgi:pyruvate formate lyase activating enzyme
VEVQGNVYKDVNMVISGLEKFTLLDYPGKTSAVIFTYGCNFRCPYCHNPELVIEPLNSSMVFSEDEVLAFLKGRVGKLDAVVITGGEPLIYNDLIDFVVQVRTLGFKVKVDTNGSNPEFLEQIIDKGVVDYWAMDIKYGVKLYEEGLNDGVPVKEDDLRASIKAIKNSAVDYEFRTTVVKGIHDVEEMKAIGELIYGSDKYYIQNFRPGKTLDPKMTNENSFTDAELKELKEAIAPYVKRVEIR